MKRTVSMFQVLALEGKKGEENPKKKYVACQLTQNKFQWQGHKVQLGVRQEAGTGTPGTALKIGFKTLLYTRKERGR